MVIQRIVGQGVTHNRIFLRKCARWSFMEPEAQAIDGGEVRLVVEGGGGREESLDLLHTENGGEPMCGLRAKEREGVPVALEDVLVEKADAAVADAHGRGGEAIDVFPVQEIALQLLFR